MRITRNTWLKVALALLAWGFPLAGQALAEEPVMLKDVYVGFQSSSPESFKEVNGIVYFHAESSLGRELYRTDGTEEGTDLVKDINPFLHGLRLGEQFGELDGLLYFPANDITHGRELWKSDGTEEGTVLVKDINPGSGDGFVLISPMVEAGGQLFFLANDGTHGHELWKTDGTEAGTVMVKDINPGPADGNPGRPTSGSQVRDFAALDDILIFNADDGVHGVGLWRSDGTEAGTELIAKFDAFGASRPVNLASFNGSVYFAANDKDPDGDKGSELWRTDGTSAGTGLFMDLNPGSRDSHPTGFLVADDVLYFLAIDLGTGRELWKTDGTTGGTGMIKDINPNGGAFSTPARMALVGGTLFFWADDGVLGDELWKTDGTEAGTVLVKDIVAGSSGSIRRRMAAFNGKVYFGADDQTGAGVELWQSDGTEAGTHMVADLNPGPSYSLTGADAQITAAGGMLFFAADNGQRGREPWKLEGDALPVATAVVLSPGSSTTPAGHQHCVQAAVTDQFGGTVEGVALAFRVTGVTPEFEESAATDGDGQANLCYSGDDAGDDSIEACVGESPLADWEECALHGVYDSASHTWILVPTTLTLEPNEAINLIGEEHCVVATVLDQLDVVMADVMVTFSVTGANPSVVDAEITTDGNGEAQYCYLGDHPGDDTIHAVVDGLTPATATKTWTEDDDPAPPGKNADLRVNITADADPVPAQTSGALRYEVVAANHGPDEATEVVLAVQLPGGIDFESATDASAGSLDCSARGRNLVCNLGVLPAEANVTAVVVVGTKGGNSLTAEASVMGNEADPDLGNNSDSVTVGVCRRDCP